MEKNIVNNVNIGLPVVFCTVCWKMKVCIYAFIHLISGYIERTVLPYI